MKKLLCIFLIVSVNSFSSFPIYELNLIGYDNKYFEIAIYKNNIIEDSIIISKNKTLFSGKISQNDSLINFRYYDTINKYEIKGTFKIPSYYLRDEITVYNPILDSSIIEVYEFKRLKEIGNWNYNLGDTLIRKRFYIPYNVKINN